MKFASYTSALLLILVSGCGLFSPPPLNIPSTYQGENFQTNAAAQLELLDRFEALVNKMKEGRDPAVTFSVDDLGQLYLDGSPSLSDQTNPYYRNLIDTWLVDMAAASGNQFDFDKAPLANGGVYGGYLFDENGLELEQMVDKGMFGAMIWYQAHQILNGTIDQATSDQLLALWGAHPDFPNSDNANLHDHPDRFAAKYAARRDQNDGSGFYTTMEQALIQLQAASVNSFDYAFELDEARQTIAGTWEAANAATVINYLYAAIDGLSKTNPTEAEIASAMHAYAEAVGFLHGWRQLSVGARFMTDAQIDQILTQLLAAPGSTPTSYLFVQDTFNRIQNLEDAIALLQEIYEFSNAELLSFKKNWVSEQGR